jgi:hypothetical protein
MSDFSKRMTKTDGIKCQIFSTSGVTRRYSTSSDSHQCGQIDLQARSVVTWWSLR